MIKEVRLHEILVSQQETCDTQRALIFQGGGALGAFETGMR
jgi:predicted acylesterase/phospholipase RssA